MKISIITVVYNNSKTILDAIISVKNQTYLSIEHIIIDGGSTDGTLEILNENMHLFNVLISEKDNGLYDAMNKGINIANGEVIGILNSDDFYNNNEIISDVMSNFISDTNLDIIYGDIIYVKHTNINKLVRYWKSISFSMNNFKKGVIPPHPSLFIKKAIYNEIGLFNLKFKIAADYEFMLRLFKNNTYKSKYLPLLMVKMRTGGISNRNFTNLIKQNIEIINAWKINNFKMPYNFFIYKLHYKLKQYFKI
jgi:glycosyltransferase involved in cell wall biosynthesis